MDKAKPTVTCELIELQQVGGLIGVYRALMRRTSSHPKLGPDREGTRTYSSRIVRIDFDHRIIETLNTYYEF